MGKKCEYVREFYGVPAEVGLRIEFKGRLGTIYKDGGNYVSVNFDHEKPGKCCNIHPTDPDLKYLDEHVALRTEKLTRSQNRYRQFQKETDYGDTMTFAEWLGVDVNTRRFKKLYRNLP